MQSWSSNLKTSRTIASVYQNLSYTKICHIQMYVSPSMPDDSDYESHVDSDGEFGCVLLRQLAGVMSSKLVLTHNRMQLHILAV